jgi:membrane-associated phospholipid phosphatase
MSRLALWLVAALALSIFVAVTVAVTAGGPIALDADAFTLGREVRSPGLDQVARILTVFGLLAVVGPAVALGVLVLVRRGRRHRAIALVAGTALTSAAVWLVKALSGRARPPHPLVHTVGESYPSAHTANAIGWVALALALGALLPSLAARVASVAVATLLAVLVGLSRIYLRAHYLTDVIGGASLGTLMYAAAAIGGAAAGVRPRRRPRRPTPAPGPQPAAARTGRRYRPDRPARSR